MHQVQLILKSIINGIQYNSHFFQNRKNDETSYEKMLKLRRDLNRAVTILELLKRREKSKKELLQLNIEVLEKRLVIYLSLFITLFFIWCKMK